MFISSFSSATVRNLKKKKKKKSEEKKIILEKDAPEEVRRRSRLTRKKPSQERSRHKKEVGDIPYLTRETQSTLIRRPRFQWKEERSRRYSLSHSGDAEYAHKTTPVPVEVKRNRKCARTPGDAELVRKSTPVPGWTKTTRSSWSFSYPKSMTAQM